jgi:mRNA interferase MazF
VSLRTSTPITRGDVWLVDLGLTRGHEQAGPRPCVIVSVEELPDQYGMVVEVPTTRTPLRFPTHVAIDPPEGGLRFRSFAMCEQVRSVSMGRLLERWGRVTPETLAAIELRLSDILKLSDLSF